jgi:hypothetical protein
MATTSAPLNVTLTNSGTATLGITNVNLSGTNFADFSQTNTCGSSVVAGGNCSINVMFTPTAAGTRRASLSITDNASGSPQIVSLTGTGVQAPTTTISLLPSSLTFGAQNTGTRSGQSVTLTNTGTATLSITSIAISGTNSADFSQSSTLCGSTLGAGISCPIYVTFTPSAAGARSATLSVTDNASGSPQTVSLTGMGVQPAVDFSPATLSFAPLGVGLTSLPQTVTVSNTGSAAVNLSNIYVVTGYFAATNNCPYTFSAGATCSISVTFSPGQTGRLNGSLSITESTSTTPQLIPLSGAGITGPGPYNLSVLAGSSTTHETGITVTVQ